MKAFTYVTADDFDAASRALAEAGPRAVEKAGGTDLLALLKSRVAEPDEVVNLLRRAEPGGEAVLGPARAEGRKRKCSPKRVKGVEEPSLPDGDGRFGSFFSSKDGYNLRQSRR